MHQDRLCATWKLQLIIYPRMLQSSWLGSDFKGTFIIQSGLLLRLNSTL